MNRNFLRLHKLGLCAFLCLFWGLELEATPPGKYNLIVHLKDGTRQTFMLSSRPNVAFESNRFVISQEASNVEFSCENVVRFSFADNNSSDIKGLRQEGLLVSYTDPQHVVIYGVNAKSKVSVTNMDGKVQPCKTNRKNNGLSVSLESLPKGVYVISVDKQNFKIIRK